MRRQSGFTLVEIMIVIAIIGVLAAMGITNYVTARADAMTNACIANLRQIDSSYQRALTDGVAVGGVSDLAPNYIKDTPTCPAGGTYALGNANSMPTCTVTGHAAT